MRRSGRMGLNSYILLFSLFVGFFLIARRKRAFDRESLRGQRPVKPVLVFVESRFNGFGAQLLRILDAFSLSTQVSSSFCIHEGKYWNYGCGQFRGWSCYFSTFLSQRSYCRHPEKCPSVSTVPAEKWGNVPCMSVRSADAATTSLSLSNTSIEVCRDLMRYMWRFNKRTNGTVAQVIGEVRLPERYVAIHVRRGDKASEVALQSLQKYVDAVKILNTSNVFIATDDGGVIETLREMLAPRKVYFTTGSEERRGHSQLKLNQAGMKRNYMKTITLLAELEIIRRADYFVGTFSSNVGRLAHILREGDARTSISLDDRWAPGVAWKTFGQKYCEDENANAEYCASQKS